MTAGGPGFHYGFCTAVLVVAGASPFCKKQLQQGLSVWSLLEAREEPPAHSHGSSALTHATATLLGRGAGPGKLQEGPTWGNWMVTLCWDEQLARQGYT